METKKPSTVKPDPFAPDTSKMTKDEYLRYVFDGMDGDGDISFGALDPDREKRLLERYRSGAFGKPAAH